MSKAIVLLLFFALALGACGSAPQPSEGAASAAQHDSLGPMPAADTLPLPKGLQPFQTLRIAGREVDIALPDSNVAYRGNLIILQGYDFPKHDWCAKAPQLCNKAKAMGYLLIMPEMGRSVYSSEFFAETRADMKKQPLRSWLVDSVFSFLQQQHQVLLPEQKNYILGLSTGGRGVALVALDRPTLFAAVAALSGDFDQSKMPTDRLMALYYGAYASQQQRWEKVDNVLYRIREWKTPIYLGHGQLDKVVPPSQTRLFYDSLRVHFDSNKVQLHEPANAAHDYQYWGSETEAVLQFFERY